MGLALTNLESGTSRLLTLRFDRFDREAVDCTVDQIHDRRGNYSERSAALLDIGNGIEVPISPD